MNAPPVSEAEGELATEVAVRGILVFGENASVAIFTQLTQERYEFLRDLCEEMGYPHKGLEDRSAIAMSSDDRFLEDAVRLAVLTPYGRNVSPAEVLGKLQQMKADNAGVRVLVHYHVEGRMDAFAISRTASPDGRTGWDRATANSNDLN